MLRMFTMLIALLVPSWALAAYQNPTIVSNTRNDNGAPVITFRFTGSAGEPAVQRSYVVAAGATMTKLRNWVDQVINELDLMHAAANVAALQGGQTVTRLAPPVITPTAKEIWRHKVDVYTQLSALGFGGSLGTALTNLKADIESTYQAGFLDAN